MRTSGVDWDELVSGWWEHHRLNSDTRAERSLLDAGDPLRAVRAAEIVEKVLWAGGEDALALIAALVDSAQTDDDLRWVGVGAMEEFLHSFGSEHAHEIDRRARQDPRFATAMRGVWWSPEDPEVKRRLGRWLDESSKW